MVNPKVKIRINPTVDKKPTNNPISELRKGPNLANGPIKKFYVNSY